MPSPKTKLGTVQEGPWAERKRKHAEREEYIKALRESTADTSSSRADIEEKAGESIRRAQLAAAEYDVDGVFKKKKGKTMASAKKKDSHDSAWFMQTKPTPKKAAPKRSGPVVGEVEVERKSRGPVGRDKDENTLAPGEFKKRRDQIDMLRQRAKPKK